MQTAWHKDVGASRLVIRTSIVSAETQVLEALDSPQRTNIFTRGWPLSAAADGIMYSPCEPPRKPLALSLRWKRVS